MIAFLALLTGFGVQAQTFGEFFRQKKTQEKYLLQQIAALKVYAGYLQKGYSIAKDGMQTVHDLKNGEFHLHDAFLSGLKALNPKLKGYIPIAGLAISYHELQHEWNAAHDHSAYVAVVRKQLFREIGENLDDILEVLTGNVLELTDGDRMQRLVTLLKSLGQKYDFGHFFLGQLRLAGQQREKELQSIHHLKNSYEIIP